MIEGLTNVMTPKPQGQTSEDETDETVERVALAGAAAIQRLITDRDGFRTRAAAQQRDLVALSAINEELRRRLALIRHHYVELATKIIRQLEQFDLATRDAMQENVPAPSANANLVALANRFKPNNDTMPSSTPAQS